jgi:hypothetical protein
MWVPDETKSTVVYLGYCKDDKFTAKATAFITVVKTDGHDFYHVVTAQHNIGRLYEPTQLGMPDKGEPCLSINKWTGTREITPIPYSAWHFHPASGPNDVAVMPFTFDDHTNEITVIPLDSSVSDQSISERKIGLGDEVFIPGLFVHHVGRKRNIPIVRIGSIAGMPEEPVKTRMGYLDAYLIEARSIGGLSGSPVFVHVDVLRQGDRNVVATPGRWFYLLGLMHGHFDVDVLEADAAVIDDVAGPRDSIHTGIGVVIPASKIVETIMQPDLLNERQQIARKIQMQGAATPDHSSADEKIAAAESTLGGNPAHREDFNRLASAASKSKPRDDLA